MKKGNVITIEEVKHLARLAKIDLTEREEKLFTMQLNDILTFFQEIAKAETTAIPPTFHVTKARDVLREDVVERSLPRDKALQNASKKENGYFKAPKIV
jgi:aspartyl-tRNA(Asn)/glutamyl-tRNA(Gln) amidotransferase subunit C